jgi:DNA-binding PadR family transcriptional regulator
MERTLNRSWPRARSRLYEEPKKLVAHGFARAAERTTGKRPRTVYSITAKGRRALAEWVPQPGAGPVLECEALVKLFYAEHGTKQDVLATLERMRSWCDDRMRDSTGISQAYLDGRGAFPERLPWLVLCGQFLEEFDLMVERWTAWATSVVQEWPDDLRQATPAFDVLEQQAVRDAEWAARRQATS